jgi:Ser/Thr protein kinase RdoA (MazF antagonist)
VSAGTGHEAASPSPAELDDILHQACERAGYSADARLLRHFSNAVYLLETEPVVARIAYAPSAASTATRALAVVQWLVDHGFPAATPAEPPSGADQPITVCSSDREIAVSFWQYHPQPAQRKPPDSGALGQIAARLHRLPIPPVPLPDFTPLDDLHEVIDSPAAHILDDHERDWLIWRVRDLQRRFADLRSVLGYGLIHADMLPGNLL